MKAEAPRKFALNRDLGATTPDGKVNEVPRTEGSVAPYLRVVMEMSYVCRLRGIETVKLNEAQATPESWVEIAPLGLGVVVTDQVAPFHFFARLAEPSSVTMLPTRMQRVVEGQATSVCAAAAEAADLGRSMSDQVRWKPPDSVNAQLPLYP